ncbi:MAG TPA: hypothetical protein VNI01_16380 [Elusimicrobiota bacterium]|jgi:hypothetical protein|nr:hypothetical protein [Elusimicrobiota bacterium]
MIFAKTATRAAEHTPGFINRSIQKETEESLELYATRDRAAILQRLDELDWEWDVGRLLETHAALLGLAGLALGARAGRGWRLVSAAALGFLLQYAVRGSYPPLRLFRGLGFRTAREIEDERHALLELLRATPGSPRRLPPGEAT